MDNLTPLSSQTSEMVRIDGLNLFNMVFAFLLPLCFLYCTEMVRIDGLNLFNMVFAFLLSLCFLYWSTKTVRIDGLNLFNMATSSKKELY